MGDASKMSLKSWFDFMERKIMKNSFVAVAFFMLFNSAYGNGPVLNL